MLSTCAGHHHNQVGFVFLSSAADDLKRLAAERMIGIFYGDSILRTVGIMGLFPGGASGNRRSYCDDFKGVDLTIALYFRIGFYDTKSLISET